MFGSSLYFIIASEGADLYYLNSSQVPSAVQAPVHLGKIIPAETGRNIWIGIHSWTPDYAMRIVRANEVFSRQLGPIASVGHVRSSGARFLLAGRQHRSDLNS